MAENPVQGQAAWSYGVAASGLLIAVLSPFLGAVADRTGARKLWIGFFAFIKITCLFCLWFAVPGASLFWVLLAFVLATVAAEFSVVFNDSMMPGLVPPEKIGHISNIAWGLGYLGGMIVLISVVLFFAASSDTGKTIAGFVPPFGIDAQKGEDARITGPIAALWYFIFILPMFFFTPDTKRSGKLRSSIGEGISELKSTIYELKQRKSLFKFLIARMIYQDGVNALLALGGGYAALMFGWTITEVGIFGIILNVVAIFGCFAASYLDTKFGSKFVVSLSVILLLIATFGIISTGEQFTLFGLIQFSDYDNSGLFATQAERSYLIYGVMIGLAFGPVQASSRSWFSRSIKAEEAGRYFGLYALAGRATSFLAPFMVAVITEIFASARLGMAVIILFFIAGLWLVLRTPYPATEIE